MRKLNTADVFAVARFIRASGMRNQLLPVIRQAAEEIIYNQLIYT